MTVNRHEQFEELISASLTEELTDAERQWLDAHLDSCSHCRATLAAFADQRRIMGGLRHVAPPRELGARVRTGIERGRFASVPFWRRPAVIFAGAGGSLAAVFGALLAIVLLNGSPREPEVGQTSPTPTATVAPQPTATATPTVIAPTLPPPPASGSPAPPGESAPPPTAAPSQTPNPVAVAPEPDVFLAFTGTLEDPALTVKEPTPAGESPPPAAEVDDTPSGPPIAAELSPDGQWLAYITEVGLSGQNEVRATRVAEAPAAPDPDGSPPPDSSVAVGETVVLGRSAMGTPFLERLAWSPDGRFLAYTLADPEPDGATDAWVFATEDADFWQLTDAGNAFAASWVAREDDAPLLWVSTAGADPMSYLTEPVSDTAHEELIDPAAGDHATAEGVFQPLLSPNGSFAIYWRGGMRREGGDAWVFVEGGEPVLAQHDAAGETYRFDSKRPLFSDLTIDQNAFASASITWGGDGDAYAVWNTQWAGDSQGTEGQYPDPARVYFGHATDPRGLTQDHAIDRDDVAAGFVVVDVKVSPTGRHLVITARVPLGGDLDTPRAELLLVERNTGQVPDDVQLLGSSEDGWIGPAAFDQTQEIVEP
jgi:hypothetical protein